jgi:arginyl-tRNA synthetase
MAGTAPVEELSKAVEGLSLNTISKKYPATHADVNPLDFWRAHLTNLMAAITGVATDIIFPTINWTSGLDKGDFIIAVPALRIKGTKPDVLGKEWIDKVGSSSRAKILIEANAHL